MKSVFCKACFQLRALALLAAVLAGVLLGAWYFIAVGVDGAKPFTKAWLTMNTIAEVKFYGDIGESERACKITEDTFAEIERACNIFNPDSEISRLNASASRAPFKCSQTLWEIFDLSRRVHAASGGAFDITVRPLMALWGFHGKRDEIPGDAEIAEALKKVGVEYEYVRGELGPHGVGLKDTWTPRCVAWLRKHGFVVR